MIDGLISGKLHGTPTERISKTGKPFALAKVRAAAGDGEILFVNVIAFDEPTSSLSAREIDRLMAIITRLRDEGKIAAGPREHVVARGESLALIAQRYQISLASLRSANKLNGDVIKVGQTLQIPATALAAQ